MITSKQMKELERSAMHHGITASELMENAGKQFFQAVRGKFDLKGKNVVIFWGTGNNGGDGLVAARYFAEQSHTLVLFFGEKNKLSEDALEKYDLVKSKVNIIQVKERVDLEKFHFQKHLDFIFIDALLGMGINGPLHDPISFGIDYFNSLNGAKIAVDIPSGLNPDTGEVLDKVCESDLIVTFHDLKWGLEQFQDKTEVVDIGIPK